MMNTVTRLTSRDNPLLKKIRLLVSGSARAPDEPVFAEGNRVLHEANRSGREIEAVVFSESFGRDTRERVLLENWHNRGIRLYCVSQKLFASLSCLQTPQGAIALVKVPEVHFPPETDQRVLFLYICGIQNPGNMGALIRTAAASGVTLVCTAKGSVSARNPKAIRSSAGVFFHHTPAEQVDAGIFLQYCLDNSIQPYRTDTVRGIPYTETDLKSPCAILLGNEGSGMTEERFAGQPAIHIPMLNGIESLNVALAGAVILFEARRQRRGQ
jgi:TrmH family RNA methyltransferase